MATIEALRARMRTKLEEATAAVWTDGEIDECVLTALQTYGLRYPIEVISTVAVLDGATSAAPPTGTRRVQRVVLADQTIVPRRHAPDRSTANEELAWELVANQLLFTQPLPVQTLTIHHTTAPSLASLPVDDEVLVILGAMCHALEARAVQDFKRGGQLPLSSSATVMANAREAHERALSDRSRRVRDSVVAY